MTDTPDDRFVRGPSADVPEGAENEKAPDAGQGVEGTFDSGRVRAGSSYRTSGCDATPVEDLAKRIEAIGAEMVADVLPTDGDMEDHPRYPEYEDLIVSLKYAEVRTLRDAAAKAAWLSEFEPEDAEAYRRLSRDLERLADREAGR